MGVDGGSVGTVQYNTSFQISSCTSLYKGVVA
jgi:hypothetical protein